MNKDTLVLLSGMAPKEPEQWSLDEWGAKFEMDYPKPWEPTGFEDRYAASIACTVAKYPRVVGFHDAETWAEMLVFQHGIWRRTTTPASQHWHDWRNECLSEFTRNEWPLLWAKKRMQAAEVA